MKNEELNRRIEEKYKEILEKEREKYIETESLFRALIPGLPKLTALDIELHMQACKDYLNMGFESIYHELTPFILGYQRKDKE